MVFAPLEAQIMIETTVFASLEVQIIVKNYGICIPGESNHSKKSRYLHPSRLKSLEKKLYLHPWNLKSL